MTKHCDFIHANSATLNRTALLKVIGFAAVMAGAAGNGPIGHAGNHRGSWRNRRGGGGRHAAQRAAQPAICRCLLTC